MKKFLFITHITPMAKRSSFRQALIEIYFKALYAQTYQNWEVIILGEENKVDGKFNYFFLEDATPDEKSEAIRKLFSEKKIQELCNEADYIIKLDDDDIISPVLLEKLKNFEGDVFYDRYHTFIDSSSGIITQQERPWIASTCVHRKEHVLSFWNGVGASSVGNLLYSDHSKSWHLYYADKKKETADPGFPVYLRVLSPTSITSGALTDNSTNGAGFSLEKYYNYLRSFGSWSKAEVTVFNSYLPAIRRAWKLFSDNDWQQIPKPSLLSKVRKRFGFFL